ncbi:MAG TPA: lytic murein transglycosylase [Hyphomicrobiales bacterium]|nr:lytic murein transglycosylase [Hyphomicrobiales bacterium]
MTRQISRLHLLAAILFFTFAGAGMTGGEAQAAQCGKNASGFSTWLEAFKQEAAAEGISRNTLGRALKGVTYYSRVVRLDRSQRSFKLSFKRFYARRVSNAMISKGRRLIKQYGSTLSRIEKRYGVPAEVIISIWGLETGYGRDSGNFAIIRSLATLAYDCRRSDFFRKELIAALKIVQRGDMSPGQLVGGWAGEIGQTQFLASSYYKYAVDFDGNGRRDLIRSVPDLLASTANYLKAKGWQRGQGWGPGTANYGVLREWNRASVYVKTISVMSGKMAGKL